MAKKRTLAEAEARIKELEAREVRLSDGFASVFEDVLWKIQNLRDDFESTIGDCESKIRDVAKEAGIELDS